MGRAHQLPGFLFKESLGFSVWKMGLSHTASGVHRGSLHSALVLGSSEVNYGDSLGSRGGGSGRREVPEWVLHGSRELK